MGTGGTNRQNMRSCGGLQVPTVKGRLNPGAKAEASQRTRERRLIVLQNFLFYKIGNQISLQHISLEIK